MKSGRRGWKDQLDFKTVTELSLRVLEKALRSEEVSESKKIDIAMHLVSRAMPKDVDVSGEVGVRKIEVEFVDKEDTSNADIPKSEERVQDGEV